MVSFATAALPFNQLVPSISASVTTAPSAPTSSCSSSNNLLKIINVSPTKVSFGLPVVAVSLKLRLIFGVALNRVASLPNNKVFWEDPDDGSGSEYDEDDDDDDDDAGEEIEESNLDFESDWEEEERVASALASSYGSSLFSTETDKHEEDLLKEVEQLLGPEERAIWQQNAAPNLGKLSTAKWSPLHSLALAGQIREMDMLLGNGLDINLVDKDGLTALHTAIIGKKEAVISHLLRKGANPNIRDQDGASPLHYAVQVGAMQTVKLLIKFNVDLNAADNEGWTPLHIAIQSRNRDIAKVLLVNGADKTRRNQEGTTPLDLALCYGKDFKSYDLAKLVKLVPANRDL